MEGSLMNRNMLVYASLAIVVALTGCTKNTDTAVVAKVNSAKITAADFKKQLDDLQPPMQQAVSADPKARKEFLEDLIGIELVLQEARRLKLDKDPAFMKKQEELEKEMKQRIQEAAKNDLFNALLKKELMDKIKQPTDEDVKAYYTKHREEIRKAAGGKDLSFKQAEAQGLKRYVFQVNQREAYLEYSKALKAKAKISVDDKALDAVVSSLSQPSTTGTLQLTQPAGKEATKGAETKK
ncbi:MAG: SurA N-terminal domain-containing protein [Nitrospirota bacterium]